VPDQARFNEIVGGTVERAGAAGGAVRIFGEMVALLWAAGNGHAAQELERFWNELARTQPFSLYCAYPIDGFGESGHTEAFGRLCEAHTHVLPAGRLADPDEPAERQRMIAVLQQRASSLEHEVAERKRVERRLAQREKELSDFVENGVIGLHSVDAQGTILWANRAELRLLGYAAEEYVGRSIVDFHVDRHVIEDILDRVLRGETLIDRPARLRAKDGSIKHVLIHSNGCFEDGKFVHTRCFTKDVTERRAAEEERDRLLKRLEEERSRLESVQLALQDKIVDLEQFQDCVVGRELKMVDLQREVEELRARLAQANPV
jgi:PAS domain S-box-containing protein